MELTVENVCGLLIRSRLLTSDEVKQIYQRWLGEAKSAAGSVEQFHKWLVARQYLTAYQAELLARGMPDNFFLNQYKILDRIGQGCMAGVYKAVHNLGQVVAIKVLPPSKAKDVNLLARFQREARLAIRLKHPNVVRTFQVGETQGLYYLVMEYLEGETLRDVLNRRSKLPPAEAVRLIHQALLGLQHFHELGMVHRDIKPDNLMLVPSHPDSTLRSTVKILDVGLSRALSDEVGPGAEETNDQLTTEGALLGTPDYMSPEQARDAHKVDIRSDIYSTGCVLYHALAGQPPFPDTNLINQMIRHVKETPRPLKDFNPAVPEGLQQIINWMMAKDQAQRYPTPERAAQALQVFLAAGVEAPRAAEPAPQLRRFLTWLETDSPQDEREMTGRAQPVVNSITAQQPPAAAAVQPPSARPVKAPRPERPTRPEEPRPQAEDPRRSSRKQSSGSHKRPRQEEPLEAPVASAAEATEEEPGINVELVPVLTPPTLIALPIKDVNLTRRDLIMLGIGAGCVTFAGVVGVGLSKLRGRKKEVPPAPAANGEHPGESE